MLQNVIHGSAQGNRRGVATSKHIAEEIGLQRRTKVIPKEFGQDKNYAAQQQVDGDVDKRRHDGAMSQTTMQSTWLLASKIILRTGRERGEVPLRKG